MSLRFAMPSGRPMIVTHSRMPVTRWTRANHQPPSTNQSTLPTVEPAPLSAWGMTVRPKGHRL